MDAFLHTFFDFSEMKAIFPTLVEEGLFNTFTIAFLSVNIGMLIGIVLAAMLSSSNSLLRIPSRIYIDIFRGLPAIVTVSLIGIGLPSAGFTFFGRSPTAYAVLAIGLISGSYMAEVFRSGIQSVPKGQYEAGRCLGFTGWRTMLYVIIPQGVKNVLPALANQFIIAIKESSLVFVLGLAAGQRDIYFIGMQRQEFTYNASATVAAALLYVAITVPLTYAVNAWDKRLQR
ncbi:amino acid ABC transporter permease [Mesorhizobium sp. M0047]|uniref:amino acid ABC transporter permease n=1 Tax=Mesorhizobium sp. M0047 TaxID=2956859 RepID=UPI003335D71A